MSEDEVLKTVPEEVRIKRLFALSFQHSQGNAHFQYVIFKWLAPYVSGMKTKISDVGDMFPKVPKAHLEVDMSGRMREQADINTTSLRTDFIKSVTDYKQYGRSDEDREFLIRDIASHVVQRDMGFVIRGRLGRTNPRYASDSSQDPYASLFRRHILLGESAGDPAFDDMYKEVARVHKDMMKEEPVYETRFNELVDTWQMHHPGQGFYPQGKKE